MPALGAPEFAPPESPDSGGSAGSTDTGALSSTSAEGTSDEAPEPGDELDETMNDEVNIPHCITHKPADPTCVDELQMDLFVWKALLVYEKCKLGGFGR